ncbi:hypothetical protein Acr_11g0000480 [Actinidia rufa]|uniref:Uncharacterized protein n=1 Tax=Actinidia rufa TaxID=165716 RepID=A0A7J0FAL4_9ERIC|nr:hypothetical protein Acr_11g0000480 [Actinidia rufa]
MARLGMLVKAGVVVLMWMVESTVLPHHAEAAISCGTRYEAAKTTADRQTACSCLNTVATLLPGINLTNADGLPAKYGLSLPYKLSPL